LPQDVKEPFQSINYLGGKGIIDETLAAPASKQPPLSRSDKNIHRVHPEEIEVRERVKNFVEIELPLASDVAIKEANRCLKCDLAYSVDKLEADMGYCIFCGLCVEACPRDALFLDYNYEKAVYKRQDLLLDKEKMLLSEGSKKVQSGFCRPRFEEKLPIQTLLQDRDKP
jgi:ferredoxin